MKIQLITSGGIVGKTVKSPILYMDNFPPHIKDHMDELIEEIDFFNIKPDIGFPGFDLIYTIISIENKGKKHTVRANLLDNSNTEDLVKFRKLLKHVQRLYEINS